VEAVLLMRVALVQFILVAHTQVVAVVAPEQLDQLVLVGPQVMVETGSQILLLETFLS
jgi:hypothetical protein